MDGGGLEVRDASVADAAACAAIYAPYVTGTAVSFEAEPPSEPEMARRIEAALASHAWLVAEQGERVVGYAYAGPLKARAAYRWSCEVSAGFHAALGFEPAGTYRRIGFKHGAWHDVAWVQRSIGADADDQAEPTDPR